MSTISETDIAIFDFFKNSKNALIFTILVGCGWLAILSYLWRLKTLKFYENLKSYFLHKTNTK